MSSGAPKPAKPAPAKDKDEKEDEEKGKPVTALDAADIALLKTYGAGPYSASIKKLEADILEEMKKVNELIGEGCRRRRHMPPRHSSAAGRPHQQLGAGIAIRRAAACTSVGAAGGQRRCHRCCPQRQPPGSIERETVAISAKDRAAAATTVIITMRVCVCVRVYWACRHQGVGDRPGAP